MDNKNSYFRHISEKRHINVNTKEYDDWLEKLLTFDVSDILSEYLWVNCDIYYLYLAKQGTEDWKKARKSRVTGSVLAEACGVNKYSSNTKDDLYKVGLEINGLSEKKFSDFAINVAMAHGSKTEPLIRSLHSKITDTNILELPIAIPINNLNIGVSIDAYLKYNNIIGEYKAPQKMYESLTNHLLTTKQLESSGINMYNYTYEHILINHYYQMHLGMFIFDKQYCDYLVYDSVKTKSYYLERIPFCNDLWDNDIYKKLDNFINNILIQQRQSNNIDMLLPPRQL